MFDPIVTVRHLRALRSLNSSPAMCTAGARAIALDVGLDWALFIREGIPASVLEATGNEFCLQLAAKAREEAQ